MSQEFTPEQIQQFIEQLNGKPEETAAPAPIKVKLGDEELTFASPDELSKGLTAAQQNYLAAQQKIKELETQYQELANARANAGRHVTGDEGPSFDTNEFITQLGKDPLAALDHALNHMLFEGKVEKASTVLREGLVRGAQAERKLVATQYAGLHPDIIANPQLAQVVENTRQQLGLSFDLNGLEAATAFAQQRGLIPVSAPQQQQQHQQTADPAIFAPPTASRGNAAPPAYTQALSEEYLESLSVEQLEALAAKMAAPPSAR